MFPDWLMLANANPLDSEEMYPNSVFVVICVGFVRFGRPLSYVTRFIFDECLAKVVSSWLAVLLPAAYSPEVVVSGHPVSEQRRLKNQLIFFFVIKTSVSDF